MTNVDKEYPTLHLSQSFYPSNGDGYMYYTQIFSDLDGGNPKKVPCLISNAKETIRLDLITSKSDSRLLVDGKYELPEEVECAVIDSAQCSLSSQWVQLWRRNEIEKEDLSPSSIINEIDSFLEKTVSLDVQTRKVLSLWIYSTYYYSLFKRGFPYLFITGPAGSGKTTIELILSLLAFNPAHATNITEAALLRLVSYVGGTFIIDGEDLSLSPRKRNESIVSILKAGYSDAGSIIKTNSSTNETVSYTAFGPKVISNVAGIDEVIADRCIIVSGSPVTAGLEDLFSYKYDKRDIVKSMSSRASLSALENFEKVHAFFNQNDSYNTGNARLTQIIRPLHAIAKLVGQDYEDYLLGYAEDIMASATVHKTE